MLDLLSSQSTGGVVLLSSFFVGGARCVVTARCPGRSRPSTIQGMSRPSRRQRSIAARCRGSFVGGRPKLKLVTVTVAAMATVAADHHVHRERATTPRLGTYATDDSGTIVPPIGCEAWNPSKLTTPRSIVISARTLLKSTPGTVAPPVMRCVEPHSVTSRLGYTRAVLFLFSLWGTGTTLVGRLPSVQTLPVIGRAVKPVRSLKRLHRLAQSLVLGSQGVAKVRSRKHHALR